MKRFLQATLAVVFLCLSVSHAATYHVAASTTGDGSGSSTSNFGAEAVALAATCGDTVNLYDDQGDFDYTITRTNLTCTSGNQLTYQAATGELPTIFGGHVLSGWTLVSGTAGVDAIYRTSASGIPSATQQKIYERDTGKEPFDSQCANVAKPLPGNKLGTGVECSYWDRNIGGTREDNVIGSIVHNGEYYTSGGFIYVRTALADNPSNHVLTMTGIDSDSAACVNGSGSTYINFDGIRTRYCGHGLLLNGSNNVTATNMDIRYSGAFSAVEIDNASYFSLTDSTIKGCGSIDQHHYECIGSLGNNSYGLIRNVDVSYAGHIGISVGNGSKLVIDDVYIHDTYGKAIQTLNYDDYLLQNSRIRDCVGAQQLENAHESAHPCSDGNGQRHIVRFNEFWAGGSYGYFIGRNKGSIKTDFWVGHNTFHKINTEVNNLALMSITQRTGDPDIEDIDIFNNLFVDNSENSGAGCQVIRWTDDATPTNTDSYLTGNGFWGESCTDYLNGQTVATFEAAWPTETGTNTAFGSEPLFAGYAYNNPDFGLPAGNPAIDAGEFLTTTTNSGTGTTFTVADANMFYRYPEIAGGEVITVGDDTGLTVTAVSGSSITVDTSFTWASGENISFDYDGTAPDMGANEGTAQGGGGSNPTVANDTLSSSNEGYGTRSVLWSALYANDTYTSATTPTIGDITGLTTSRCTVANDVGNTEVDITEVSGTGPCQFSYTLTDDVGTSSAATVTFQVVSSGSSYPTLRSTSSASSATGGNISPTEPTGCAENDLLVAVHGNKQGVTPTTNTGYTSLQSGNALATGLNVQYIVRGASAPDLSFPSGQSINPAQVELLCYTGIDTGSPIDDSGIQLDADNGDSVVTSPSITTVGANRKVLRVGVARNDSMTFASSTEVLDNSPESSFTIAVASADQASAGASGTEVITGNVSGAIHAVTLAIAGAASATPEVLADAYTAADDTAIDGRSPDTGSGVYEAETSCDVDSNALSCATNDGFIIPTQIVDGTITFDWNTGDATQLVYLVRSDSEVPTFSGGFTTENAYVVVLKAGTTDTITIQEIVDGSVNGLTTYSQAFDASTTYSISIDVSDNAAECTSTTITVEVDAANTQSVSTSSCHQGTFTGARGSGTTWTIDNLSVTSDDTPDTTAPTAPTHDTTISGQLVTLTLTPGTDAGTGIEGYEIHKDDCAGGAFSLLTYVMDDSGSNITYEDPIGASETCKYKTRMLDNSGNFSTFSAETSETSSSNNAPACDASIAVTAATDVTTRYNVITEANCTDADADTMTVTAISSAASNGNASVDSPASNDAIYNSDEFYAGSDSFAVTVSDGNGGTDTVTVNVTVSEAPSGTLYVGFTWNSQGSPLVDADGIYFDCSDLSGTDIANNRDNNPPYEIADETTDSNGDIVVYLYGADEMGLAANDEVFCSFLYPDATATNGYRTIAAELTLQAVP